MQRPIKPSPGRVLCWTHKYGTCLVFARTLAEDLAAYLMLFKAMDGQSYYWDVGEDDEALAWYLKAKEGDGAAAKCLLEVRSDVGYQYEGLSIERIDTPPAKPPVFGEGLRDPDAPLPPHIVELATRYGENPEHTQALLDGYRRGDSISVVLHPCYKRPPA
jgi:hypothetical protein